MANVFKAMLCKSERHNTTSACPSSVCSLLEYSCASHLILRARTLVQLEYACMPSIHLRCQEMNDGYTERTWASNVSSWLMRAPHIRSDQRFCSREERKDIHSTRKTQAPLLFQLVAEQSLQITQNRVIQRRWLRSSPNSFASLDVASHAGDMPSELVQALALALANKSHCA